MPKIVRNSSMIVDQNGATSTVANVGGQLSTVYSNPKGNESSPDPASLNLSDLARAAQPRESINGNVWGAVLAYFTGISGSKTVATSNALMLIDAAKIKDIDPLVIIDYHKHNITTYDDTFYALTNTYLDPGAQKEKSSTISNATSIKVRLINA